MQNQLKAVSTTDNELRVANYIVLFGGQDLVGEFFTKATQFDSGYTNIGLLHVDFEHGLDHEKTGNSDANVLGIVDWKTARVDEHGIFVERVLNRRAKYIQYLEPLIDAGIVGTSSEAVRGGVRKKGTGEITDWPLMRDSLTVTPMEPRMVGENVLSAAKSLTDFFPGSESLAALLGQKPRAESLKTIEQIESLRDAEHCLRDAGMSRTEAVAFIARIKSCLGQGDPDEDVIAALKHTTAIITNAARRCEGELS